jgi:hypothetical protein
MPGAFSGFYLDGRSAMRQPVSIRLAASGLEITTEGQTRLWWPFREVRQTQGFYAGEQIRLERGAPFPEMLLVDDIGFLAALRRTAPGFGRRFHNPRRRRVRVLLTVGAAGQCSGHRRGALRLGHPRRGRGARDPGAGVVGGAARPGGRGADHGVEAPLRRSGA